MNPAHIPATDLTLGSSFSGYLSSFWSQIFTDHQAIQGLADANARQVAQLYQDFIETVNSASIDSMSPWHRELVYPLVINESTLVLGQGPLEYGDGAVYGPQPYGHTMQAGRVMQYGGNRFFSGNAFPVPSDVMQLGPIAVEQLYSPSLMMVSGSDFFFDTVHNIVTFRDNPFENPAITSRVVDNGSGVPDRQIVLWFINTDVEKFQMYQQYGFLFCPKTAPSEQIQGIVSSIFKLYSGGPSINMLDSFIAAICNAPVASKGGTVQSVETFQGRTLVVTDTAVYPVTQFTVRSHIVPGYVLKIGEPLTTATAVNDRLTDPYWWSRQASIPVGRNILTSDLSCVVFPNTEETVSLSPIQTENGTQQLCRFALQGNARDVQNFWDIITANSLATGTFLSANLWTTAGLVDGSGNPDYTQQLIINPAKFLTDTIARQAVCIEMSLPPNANFLSAMAILNNTLPVQSLVFIFINIPTAESYTVSPSGATQQSNVARQQLPAILSDSISSFDSATKSAWSTLVNGEPARGISEALSITESPAMMSDTLTFTSGRVSETVTIKYIEACN